MPWCELEGRNGGAAGLQRRQAGRVSGGEVAVEHHGPVGHAGDAVERGGERGHVDAALRVAAGERRCPSCRRARRSRHSFGAIERRRGPRSVEPSRRRRSPTLADRAPARSGPTTIDGFDDDLRRQPSCARSVIARRVWRIPAVLRSPNRVVVVASEASSQARADSIADRPRCLERDRFGPA